MRTLPNCVTLLLCAYGLVLASALTSSDECLHVHENKKLVTYNGLSLDRMVSSLAECLQWCFEIGPKSCAAYQYDAVDGLCQLYNGIQLSKINLADEPGTVFVEVLGKCSEQEGPNDRVKREAPPATGTGAGSYATWGPWAAWGQCSATCGGGQQTRTRQCSVYGACGYGGNSGVQACNTQGCCTEWGAWCKCSVTCGTGGTQTRERRCPVGTGNTYQSKTDTQTQPCQGYMPPCATWAEWGPWGACSVTCGKGQTTRERQCQGGNTCVGETKETQDCDKGPCPTWADWQPWGPCSVTCGTGQSSRERQCQGGTACVGEAKGTQDCDKGPCYTWSSWSEWSECTVLCGGGSRNRTRQCPVDGGCSGLNDASDICNMMPCPDWGEWSPWSDCTVTCGNGSRSRTRSCPIPKACTPGEEFESDATCGSGACPTWTDWTAWGACTKTCGEGNRKRTRTCSATDGCLGSAENVEPCFEKACTLSTEWSQWSPCTATCGGGTQTRSRVKCPAGPPTCPIEEGSQACNPQACPGWAEWGPWGQCSKTCGGGQRTRTRTCPVTNGCVGAASDIDPQPCNAQGCNVARDAKSKGPVKAADGSKGPKRQ